MPFWIYPYGVMRSQSLKYYSFNRKTFKAVSFAFVSDQLVTDSQQLHFNDSIFNYQYPPLSVQPFSASFTFFLFVLARRATQCTIATSWDVANAFNSNYLCWLLGGGRRQTAKRNSISSQHLDLPGAVCRQKDWHFGQVEIKVESASSQPPDIVSICQA